MSATHVDSIDLHSTARYVEHGYPWAEWDHYRSEAPIYWYERDDIAPFWSITRHADILEVSRRADVFVNSRRLRLQTIQEDEQQELGRRLRAESQGWDLDEPPDFIFMDDPRHRKFRLIPARRFTPAALRKLEGHFRELAERFAGELVTELEATRDGGESCDFVRAFAQKLPLAAIGEMMGLPPDDWMHLKRLTNVMIGAPEPEFIGADESATDARVRAYHEMSEYMIRLSRERKGLGETEDLSSLIIHGQVDGQPLTEQQVQGYLFVILAAGNETTQNAISGGVSALLAHPDECARLCENPELVPSAVEEILRWTSPVVQFARTAAVDTEISGTRIRAGEDVGMWYPSANRDEEVFDDPYRFDIARAPNHHLAFGGFGAHFCLGANLARWELRAALRALLPILPRMVAAGPIERVPNLHVSAIHRMPVRCE